MDLETQILIRLARPSLDGAAAVAVEELLDRGPDWDRLIDLAYRHKVTPFLCRHLPSFKPTVPWDVEDELQELEFTTSCQVLQRTGELVRIVSALGATGVVAVPYKGPALGAQVYGSGALRPPGDLDLVVRPQDVPRARDVLGDLGHDPMVPAGDSVRTAFMMDHRYDERFVGPGGARVELHWAFTNRDFPFAPDLDELFERLGTVELAGHAVPGFRVDDLVLILSVHGAKHRWDRLEWLAAIAQIVRTRTDIDWVDTLRRASSMGIGRTLLLPLLLVEGLFGVPVPPGLSDTARSDRRIGKLAAQVVELLGRDIEGWSPQERLRRDRFRLVLLERHRDVARFLWHRALTPSEPEEWDVRRIGPALVPMHSLRRPFHVGGQLFAALKALIPGFRR